MDTFEINKIIGAILFALLVIFGTRTVTDIIFAPPKPEKPGYEVAIVEEDHGAKKEEKKAEVPLATLLKQADAGKGQAVAKKCTACHSFDQGGPNKVGPNLYGIIGRTKASHEGFAYSDALKSKGGTWSYEDLDAFLENPKGYTPGTKMAFAGIKRSDQRADLILYLRSLGGNPPPLPEPQAAAQMPAEPAAAPEKPMQAPAAPEKPAQPR